MHVLWVLAIVKKGKTFFIHKKVIGVKKVLVKVKCLPFLGKYGARHSVLRKMTDDAPDGISC